ncbi:DNA-binding regulatory protein, YebC/PmpR family [Alteribacillus persepolensis]|uniref:Probable transcriptional regulatory protein SAMN05192534_10783 n=1 Tax=Alteribacillus persepolensis TaxID=568899 RepID=A0A1G8DGJ8_9BACI|nr:YebC/PmpR family DNA-binding transcriptional regulator [Alteribacillus persepolensis]SDH56847.1 DNA-binding regulatory protein, YebC/PmpR family [Alteribacillus persepolensis]
MAGHSKWHNIKRRKESQDAKRAKIFTKLSKEIFAAVREGGTDPQTNLRLRMALTKARAENIPNDNIERTIKKAAGDTGGVQYEEITYEGYGPGGAAVFVQALTDNKNRSAADIRHAFTKHGGNLGEDGCVSFLFDKKGQLLISKTSDIDEEELMLAAIEAGADECEAEDDYFYILTAPEEFEHVKKALENDYHFSKAEVTMIPQTNAELTDEHAEKMLKLIDALEDNDDVQSVYHNFKISDEQYDRVVNG